MSNGLFLSVQEFNELPTPAKLTCLYENQCRTLKVMSSYEDQVKKSKILNKWILSIGGVLVMGIAFLFTLHIK